MNEYFLSRTDGYHKHELDSLGWEVTLSAMLESPKSPCRSVIRKNDSFGNLLYDFLCKVVPMDRIQSLLEIGGGYGYLMRDFLGQNRMMRATMVDISPFLLKEQRKALDGFDVSFLEQDFFEIDDSVLLKVDLAILNEIMGDFPTACDIPRDLIIEGSTSGDGLLEEVLRIYSSYGLALPERESFNLNLGAILAVEKICTSQIPYVYLSEHSCEASVPQELSRLLEIHSTGDPERIHLKGHDEYTVRFSDLEKVADFFGYKCQRGQYIDFIEPVIDGDLPFILCLDSSKVERYEIIRQFVEDLVKYEYIVLSLKS